MEEGGDVQIDVSFNVLPEPSPADITWVKAPSKKVNCVNFSLDRFHREDELIMKRNLRLSLHSSSTIQL